MSGSNELNELLTSVAARPTNDGSADKAADWRVIGKSVRGASHVRTNQETQDCIGWLPESAVGPPITLVVADGHGSAKYFRSGVGSRLAVDAMAAAMQKFGERQQEAPNLSVVKNAALEWLPQDIVRRWRDAVQKHIDEKPLSSKELDALSVAEGPSAAEGISANPFLAYGTTGLGVAVTKAFTVFLQLGDGDILTVSGDGEVSPPLAEDERQGANESFSFSSSSAWRDFRGAFRVAAGAAPALIIAATDGCANSFEDPDGLPQFCTELWAKICENGLQAVEDNLATWLEHISRAGCRDDISVGILCRIDAIERDGPAFLAKRAKSSEAVGQQVPAALEPDSASEQVDPVGASELDASDSISALATKWRSLSLALIVLVLLVIAGISAAQWHRRARPDLGQEVGQPGVTPMIEQNQTHPKPTRSLLRAAQGSDPSKEQSP